MSRLAALGRAALRWARRLVVAALVAVVLGWAAYRVLDRLYPFPEEALRAPPASPVVTAADGRWLRVGLTDDQERALPLPDGPLPPWLVRALVAQEDRRFFEHAGVDLRALARAAASALAGRREGGSTLSMQAARLVAPSARSVGGKLVQIFRALQLEEHASKEQILRLYLDHAPFGGNLRGARAAARALFGAEAATLTPAQAALLVSLLPAPARRSPREDAAAALRRRNRVLAAMHAGGSLSAEELGRALAEPLGLVAPAFPDRATDAWIAAGEGPTAIDLPLQSAVERLVEAEGGPDGLAVALVEHGGLPEPLVRALVGGRGPRTGGLDATRRPRSAGSTLKPFLWALALDEGRLAPGTRLLDLPWSSPEWEPRDLDGLVRGPVRAAEALAASWNLPAVRVAADLPAGAFAAALARAGLRHVRAPDAASAVDLALGTDDVTPLELLGAYVALAQGGRCAPLRLSLDGAPPPAGRLCSPGAAALVLSMLDDPSRARPEGAPGAGVAWKTGTSSRRRDAWAVGVTTRFAAVVWRGWLSGRPDPDLLGARSAAPLLARVMGAADPSPEPFPAPGGVRRVRVCAESGLAAGPGCVSPRDDLVPEGAAPLALCPLHRSLPVDAATGCLCCPRCRPGPEGVEERALTLYPAPWAAFRRRAGLPVDFLPGHLPTCPEPLEPEALRPVLLAPRAGQEVVAGADGTVAVRAISAEGGPLTLLVDGVRVATLADDEPQALPLRPGTQVLTLLTGGGRACSARVRVSAAR